MKELIGRANKEGESFWREIGVNYNSSEDDDYAESEVEEDYVDSDFDLSESYRSVKNSKKRKLKPKPKKTKIKKVVETKDAEQVVKKIFIITKMNGGESNGKVINGKKT